MSSNRSSSPRALLVGLLVLALGVAVGVAVTSMAGPGVQLALYVGIGVLGLVAVFGGIYYWRAKQDTYDKLR